jgi:hypothetical protein
VVVGKLSVFLCILCQQTTIVTGWVPFHTKSAFRLFLLGRLRSHELIVEFLLSLARTITLGSESHGTHGLIALTDGSWSLQPKSNSLYDWRFPANQFVLAPSF